MPPLANIPIGSVRAVTSRCIHPARSMAQADLFELEWEGTPAILKDYHGRPALIRATLGRIVLGREFRALRRLDGVAGVPRLLADLGPHAMLMERLEAERLPRDEVNPPPIEFFDRLDALVSALHERGIGHGDLRRTNIMIDSEQRPYLIDFATAVTAKSGDSGLARIESVVTRYFFRRMARVDRAKLARIKAEFHPEALSKAERRHAERNPWYMRIGRGFKKYILRYRKPHHRSRLMKRVRHFLRDFGKIR